MRRLMRGRDGSERWPGLVCRDVSAPFVAGSLWFVTELDCDMSEFSAGHPQHSRASLNAHRPMADMVKAAGPGVLPGPSNLSGGFPVKHFIVTVYTAGGRYRGDGIARTWSELGQAAAEHFGTSALRIVVRPVHV